MDTQVLYKNLEILLKKKLEQLGDTGKPKEVEEEGKINKLPLSIERLSHGVKKKLKKTGKDAPQWDDEL